MEVTFDEKARREYLTGFHKRKLARTEAARKKAVERQKQERLLSRRERRRLIKERAAENAALVESAYGIRRNEDDESENWETWNGISTTENQFEDEEQLATVTVVDLL